VGSVTPRVIVTYVRFSPTIPQTMVKAAHSLAKGLSRIQHKEVSSTTKTLRNFRRARVRQTHS